MGLRQRPYLIFALLLMGGLLVANRADAYVSTTLTDPSGSVLTCSSGSCTVGTDMQNWLHQYGGAVHDEWHTGPGVNGGPRPPAIETVVAEDEGALLAGEGGIILPAIADVIPWVAGGVAAFEVCNALTDGCFLFGRDDPAPPPTSFAIDHLDWAATVLEIEKDGTYWGSCSNYPPGTACGNPDMASLRYHDLVITRGSYNFWNYNGCNISVVPVPQGMTPWPVGSGRCTLPDGSTQVPYSDGPAVRDLTAESTVTWHRGDDPSIPNSSASWPTPSAARGDALVGYLNTLSHAQAQRIVDELAHLRDPQNPDPYQSTATIPNCDGVVYATCLGRLQDAGFTDVARTTASFADADVSKGPNAVLDISPATGTEHNTDVHIDVNTNPDAADMPVVIPSFAPAPGESADGFMSRLTDVGLQPQETTTDLDFAPGTVYETSPPVGSRVHQGDEVKVRVRTAPRDSCADHGTNVDPDPSRGWKPLQRAQFDDAPTPPAPFEDGDGNSIPLRWGATLETSTIGTHGYPVGWKGWGYRKIEAKHGWNAADIAATEQALQQPPETARWSGGLVYLGLPRVIGSDVCERLVVVDTNSFAMPDGTEHLTKGIITSYDLQMTSLDDDGMDDAP
jgi:PASTA domain